jgi:hypothetical protein
MGWPGGERVQGNGIIKKQTREPGHFTGVAIGLSGNTELRIGNTESITIETDENLLPLIETVIENGTLQVRPTRRNMNLQSRSMHIIVTAKEVRNLVLGSSGSIVSDALKAPHLSITLGGSGSINVKGVDSRETSLVIGGSGNLKVGAGSTDSLSITIGGSGDIDATQVKAKDVSVTVGGSGTANVWAESDLSATIAGSGDVNYYGDPRVSRNVLGSGGTKRLGAAPR